MCDHLFLSTGYSNVCQKCGLETSCLRLDVWNKYSAPLHRNYDRGSRFHMKVEKLLGLHKGPSVQDPVWKTLKAQQATLERPEDVRSALRRSSLKAKHYDCCRLFCKVFTKFRVAPYDSQRTEIYLNGAFKEVHRLWQKHELSTGSFFSYDFLLRHFLETIKSPLVAYLKPRSNKRRVSKYKKLLAVIRFRNASAICYRSLLSGRLPNELGHSCYLPCPPPLGGVLSSDAEWERQAHMLHVLASRAPGRPSTFVEPTDDKKT